MNSYPLGIDVSWYNGPGDWEVARSRGVQFAFVRAGGCTASGSQYTDELLGEHLQRAHDAGVITGLYYYMRPAFDYRPQVELFNLLLLTHASLWQLPPVIDVESGGVAAGTAAARVREFARAIMHSYPNKPPIIYTRESYWDTSIAPDALWPTLKLWAARYNDSISSPWGDGKGVFRDWQEWTFWQYSADNNGQGAYYGFGEPFRDSAGKLYYPDKDMDLNYFNGNIEQLYALAGLEPPEPPPPPTSDDWHNAIDAWARSKGYTGPKWSDVA